ncbi:MAG: PilZ domain-containing protein [candidate division Zixibacteria bacterium]|nr:PilZ domain-containing protein [candidate division Zixibacteria bacterium]
MSDRQPNIPSQTCAVLGELLDLAYLVGREIVLFSEQCPGKEMKTRVVSVTGRQMLVDGVGRQNALENLVNNQHVVIQFSYKGQDVSVKAILRRTSGGRCTFHLDEKVVPLSQRRHRRVDLTTTVRLAPFPISTFSRKNLARLRWIGTSTENFSSGGALLDVPGYLERDVFLLINLSLKHELFPALILGQVRHCHPGGENKFRVGVEFVTKEIATRVLPQTTARELPPVVFSYTAVDRERLNKIIQAWTPEAANPLL